MPKHQRLLDLEKIRENFSTRDLQQLDVLVPSQQDKQFYRHLTCMICNLIEFYDEVPDFELTDLSYILSSMITQIYLVLETDKHAFKKFCNKQDEDDLNA